MDIEYVVGYEEDIMVPRMASRLGATAIPVTTKRFDDREITNIVGFDPDSLKDISSYDIKGSTTLMIARNTRPSKSPDEHMMNNFRVLGTLKRQEPDRLVLFAPYMHYAAQDKPFLGGSESWTMKDVAELYETRGITDLITINSHLYGKEGQDDLQSFFDPDVVRVHDLGAEKLFSDCLKKSGLVVDNPVIVGPDEGALGMVKKLSEQFSKSDYVCISQERDRVSGHKEIVDVPTDISIVEGRPVVIYDDMIRSGKTTIDSYLEVKKRASKDVYAAATHLVMSGALKRVVDVGAKAVMYTNSLIRPFYEREGWFKAFRNSIHEIDTVPLAADYIKNL